MGWLTSIFYRTISIYILYVLECTRTYHTGYTVYYSPGCMWRSTWSERVRRPVCSQSTARSALLVLPSSPPPLPPTPSTSWTALHLSLSLSHSAVRFDLGRSQDSSSPTLRWAATLALESPPSSLIWHPRAPFPVAERILFGHTASIILWIHQ